jgi:hypothetical protein
MDKKKRNLILESFAFFCSLLVVVESASERPEMLSNAQMLGLIIGSFAAGATFTNLIRNHVIRRKGGQ